MTGVGRHTDGNLIGRLDCGLKNKDSEQNCKNPSHAHPVRLWPPNAKTDLHVGSSLLVRLVLSKHLQTVSLLQLRHPVEEKRFVVAASDDLMLRATRLSASFEKLCDLRKVILEACRTDDLDDTRRFWAGVPRRCAGHCKVCRHMCPALPQRSRHRSAPQFFPQARRRVRPPSYERVAEQAGTERSDFRRLQAVHWSGSPTP